MKNIALIILVHQIIFQGMFFAKNILLRHRLGIPVRGKNREAKLSIGFMTLFIMFSFLLGLLDTPVGTVKMIAGNIRMAISIMLLVMNLLIAAASLIGLKDSWRIGILEEQQTDLVEGGIYRFSRNPYFLSYLIMFAAYTILLQNVILLALSLVGFAVIHMMVLREENHLMAQHAEKYNHYRKRVARYFIV